VEPGERWVVVGPNGAGKSTLLEIAATTLFPTSGSVDVLGRRLGRVDARSLRPRIGLASAALAERIPGGELVSDVVVSAGYSVLGRWREAYGRLDMRRALGLLERLGVAGQKVLVLTDGVKPNVFLSGRNLPDVHVMPYGDVSTYHLLWSDVVLIEATAIGHTMTPIAEAPLVPPREARPATPAAPVRAVRKTAKKAATGEGRKAAGKKTAKKTAKKAAKKAAGGGAKASARKSPARKSAGTKRAAKKAAPKKKDR
jgi:energy-coupling factor transporter ATP-binding protein EcfA2